MLEADHLDSIVTACSNPFLCHFPSLSCFSFEGIRCISLIHSGQRQIMLHAWSWPKGRAAT